MSNSWVMSDDCQKKIDVWVNKFPKEHKRSAVIMALRIAQDEYGYVNEEVIHAVANYLDLPLVQVSEVATFYTMYRHQPCGKFRLAICNSISCMLCGSKQLISDLEDLLGVKLNGGPTQDGLFSLHETECLAACAMAPALIVNDVTYHYHMDKKKAEDLISALRKEHDDA